MSTAGWDEVHPGADYYCFLNLKKTWGVYPGSRNLQYIFKCSLKLIPPCLPYSFIRKIVSFILDSVLHVYFWLHCFWLYGCIMDAVIWNYPRTRNNPDREFFALQSLGLCMKHHAVYGLNVEPLTLGNPGTRNVWECSIFTIPCT